jgi:hypothetical protein
LAGSLCRCNAQDSDQSRTYNVTHGPNLLYDGRKVPMSCVAGVMLAETPLKLAFITQLVHADSPRSVPGTGGKYSFAAY